jgi:hypothetical protein
MYTTLVKMCNASRGLAQLQLQLLNGATVPNPPFEGYKWIICP